MQEPVLTPVISNFFYYSLCHYCKNSLEKYQRCASCKSVSYCSEQHQILDWKKHKKFCKAIKCTQVDLDHSKRFTFEEWKAHRLRYQVELGYILKRDLLPLEYQILMFPRVCAVCHHENNLIDCGKCGNIAYCSNEHMQQHLLIHNNYCDQLKLCMDIDRYLSCGNCYPTIDTQLLVKILLNAAGMHDILKLLSNSVTSNLTIEDALKSEAIAPSVIIYNALRNINLAGNNLVIHIVGSSSPEATLDWHIMSEVIFHNFPNLLMINFVLIGPESWLISDKVNLCTVCSSSGKTVSVKALVSLYHEIVDVIEIPNLVIAFNCGIHEHAGKDRDKWKRSLTALLKYEQVPLLFTSYTEDELVKDSECLNQLELNFQFTYQGKNQFASLRPLRDWSTKDMPIFYSHAYMGTVIRV